MALTDFSALTTEQKTAWSKSFWHHARNNAFVGKFMGKGPNAMIQRVTELKKSEKGARAVITLLTDLEGDGVAGDNQLEGNEEALSSQDIVIQVDQLRHANRIKGRMADQKSIVNFRVASRDALAYWMADRMDQLAFLTLAGVGYGVHTNGAPRTDLTFSQLEFAPAPGLSAGRHLRWDGTAKDLAAGDTAAVTPSDKLTYQALVRLKAYAKANYIRPIRTGSGEEVYHIFVTPQAMASLKLDPDYLANVRYAGVRGSKNQLFTGSAVMVDGMVIHEYHHVFNTTGAAAGSKWGAAGDVDGCRVLLCGAQALGFADLGDASWDEWYFDYRNQLGISISKILGFVKPKFKRLASQATAEDFATIALDVAL